MKAQHPKIKTQLFSCGFFRHCTRTVLSPTTPHLPPLPSSSTDPLPLSLSLDSSPPLTQLDPPTHHPTKPESEFSSSLTSQSFTQWKFALPDSPSSHSHNSNLTRTQIKTTTPTISSTNLQELFHAAELQLSAWSQSEQLAALHLLERSLIPYPPPDPVCPPKLMRELVRNLKNKAGAKAATKILLALCLAEGNRHVAVEASAAAAVVEMALELEAASAEQALATLELMCTVADGAAAVRAHAPAVLIMVMMIGQTSARGKEYAISVLVVIYGSGYREEEAAEAGDGTG